MTDRCWQRPRTYTRKQMPSPALATPAVRKQLLRLWHDMRTFPWSGGWFDAEIRCTWLPMRLDASNHTPFLFLLPHSKGLRTRRLWVQWDQCCQSLPTGTTGPPGRQTASGFEVWAMYRAETPCESVLVIYTEVLSSSLIATHSWCGVLWYQLKCFSRPGIAACVGPTVVTVCPWDV